ncbi:MAG: hypothetical protein ACM31D_10705 [Bacteroidota bacterium]
MSLTRHAPQILESFRQFVVRPVAAARIVVPGLALVAGGQMLAAGETGLTGLGLALTMFAITGMAFLWQRALVEGEPMSALQLAPRLLLWTVILQLLQGFELAPTILFGLLLKDMPNAEIYTRAGIQLFQILIGGLFLILPQLALGRWRDMAGTKLQEMVLAGGLAVGLGYVIINLPFMVLGEIAKALFADFLPTAGETTVTLTLQMIHALNVLVVAGYMALVWRELKDLPSRLNPPAEADDEAAPKERRTTRINRATKARK